ncbi:MAG: glycine--tRNA ligase subunit beta [Synergistaceae bacterium]|nr:glycine--tRNA ligase subunit beta [Candidatus Equadaptatus faecalis]
MSVKDLLFEIGTEEIPARFMPKALEDLRTYAAEEFSSLHIDCGEISAECTPRRLVLFVKDVEEAQQDSVESFRGPAAKFAFDADGNPTKAAEGFARGKGLTVAELSRQDVNGVEYLFAEVSTKGQKTEDILPSLLTNVINKLSFGKSMYWADPTVRFARPVRWLTALFGSETVPVTFGKIASGRTTCGHRFMGSGEIELSSADDYAKAMEDNFVVTNPEKRREMILSGIAEIEKELGAKVEIDPDLLEENVFINEYPVPFYGSFDKSFLEIPQEVLILTMAKNQRYFPVHDKAGKLMPYFIGVSNNKAKDMNVVREGNERVLRARLYDAAFFWKEDLQKSIDAMADELKNVTYQVQLGSVYDKVSRVKELAVKLASILGRDDVKEDVARAATLAKFDVVSSMVYEFAEVQGVMAREYAKKAGEKEAVANALYEQYLPVFAGDALPSGIIGAVLGLAERADTIAAIFKIGLEPTSSQDPYGLRRAARCINEIILGLKLDINVKELMAEAAKPLGLSDETLAKINDFLYQRLQVQFKEKGLSHEAVVLALQTIAERPLQAYAMAETLQKFAGEEWFAELITAAVRVKNILAKAESENIPAEINSGKLVADAEKAFAKALDELTVPAEQAIKACDWEKLAATLAQLAPVIAKFFEDVLVMDKDSEIRANRLALLAKSQSFFMLIGDFSLLK